MLASNDGLYNQDWRQKYIELSETLAETRADLEEFQQSSKELEEEMTLEIERTERAQQELKAKVSRVESERDEWKSKYMTLQTTHNTATTSLQRELDTLRQQQQAYKVQMRELEMGNDDLERNERAVMSSLADIEGKYSRVLEEKILLEHELLDKANLEEETQRLKDEVRDANEEISNLKRLLEQARAPAATSLLSPPPKVDANDPSHFLSPRRSLDEDLLQTSPPDLLLSDLTPIPLPTRNLSTQPSAIPPLAPAPSAVESAKPLRPNGQLPHTGVSTIPTPAVSNSVNPPSSLPRSSTLPTLSPARTTMHTAHGQNFARPNALSISSTSQGPVPKSKGVQMISALRSRVQTTHQRLMPGIPRLRMGSVTTRSNPPPMSTGNSSGSRNGSNDVDGASIADERSKRQEENRKDSNRSSGSGSQSPGWVLIHTQDDSPFNKQEVSKNLRRASSPVSPTSISHTPPSAFQPPSTTNHNAITTGIPRRPHSRLSNTGLDGTNARTGGLSVSTSIPALSSRPSTPTFLPVPTFNHQGGSKRSMEAAPVSFPGSVYNPRRSSLGMVSTTRSVSPCPPPTVDTRSKQMQASSRERPTSVPAAPRTSFGSSQVRTGRSSALGYSRIGKPGVFGGGRRSTGDTDDTLPIAKSDKENGRSRTGSTTHSGTRLPFK